MNYLIPIGIAFVVGVSLYLIKRFLISNDDEEIEDDDEEIEDHIDEWW